MLERLAVKDLENSFALLNSTAQLRRALSVCYADVQDDFITAPSTKKL